MGVVFNIQRFCVNDGPGIRTTVFLKGCPLDCAWCHNPESKSGRPQMICRLAKCADCGACGTVCPTGCHSFVNGRHRIDFLRCTLCGSCAAACPRGAIETVGREYAVSEVLAEVEKDRIFYDTSGGGMTVSGGEPFYQSDFLIELLRGAKRSAIHTAVETSGFAAPDKLVDAAESTDIFLYDFKLSDSGLHKRYTGADNGLILRGLKLLCGLGKPVVLRCPIIPGINDSDDHLDGIVSAVKLYGNIKRVELEPYHRLGEAKLAGLGIVGGESFRVPSQGEMNRLAEYLRKNCPCEIEVP